MKILHVNVTYQFGSTGRLVEDIHQKLMTDGHMSHVIYGRHFHLKNQTVTQASNRFSHLLHGLKTRLLDRHGFGSYFQTKKLFKKIKVQSFDVIHLHNLHGYYIHIKELFKVLKKANKPVIWTLHDSWAYTGHCFGYQEVSCMKWKTGCHTCPQKHMYPKSILLDQSKKNYHDKKEIFTSLNHLTLVTPSSYLLSELKSSFLKDIPSRLILNGIDLSSFKTKSSFTNHPINILGVASIWESYKGLNDFIKLSQALDKEHYQITLVGRLPKHILLPKEINHIPFVSSKEELNQIYQNASIYLHLASEDNLPTTAIEAIAAGTPVVAYDVGGIKDIIQSSQGIIVKSKDLHAVTDAIFHIISNQEVYQPKIVSKDITKFDRYSMIQKYIELYHEVKR